MNADRMTQKELDAIPDATAPFVREGVEIVGGVSTPVRVVEDGSIVTPERVTDAAGQGWLVGRSLSGTIVKRRAP